MVRTPRKTATPLYTLLQGCYWAAYCILLSFSSVYLLDRGFTNAQIGAIISAACLLSALLQPFAAAAADRGKRLTLRQFTALIVLALVLCAAAESFLPGKLLQAAGYMLQMILLQLLMPFLNTLAMDCVNNHIPLNFGFARGFGAMAYGLASAVCGALAAGFGAGILPLGTAVTAGALLAGVLAFRYGGPVERTLPGEAAAEEEDERHFLRRYPIILPMLIALSLLFTSHNILISFPYQIVQNLGGDSGELGVLLTVMSVMDIPPMVLFTVLLRRRSSRFWVKCSAVSFFLHPVLVWLSPNLPILCAAQIMEMTGYAVYIVASVYFVNELVDTRDRVKGQTWFAMANTIGIVAGSLTGGVLLDLAGTGGLLAFASLTGGAGMAGLLALLRNQPRRK